MLIPMIHLCQHLFILHLFVIIFFGKLYLYVKGSAENVGKQWRNMTKIHPCLILVFTYYCIKTESGSESNIADANDHDIHSIKAENGSGTHLDSGMDHDLHRSKTESGSGTNTDGNLDHDVHRTKTECDFDANIAEFNNLAHDCTKTGHTD
jgi:hypothetical protein